MNKTVSKFKSTPLLTIDFKKYRIRIHKQTIHLISDPDYIQFFINPNAKKIIIVGSNGFDHLAHNAVRAMNSPNSLELTSRSLLRQIKTINPIFTEGKSFNLYGTVENRNTIAVFDICDDKKLAEV